VHAAELHGGRGGLQRTFPDCQECWLPGANPFLGRQFPSRDVGTIFSIPNNFLIKSLLGKEMTHKK